MQGTLLPQQEMIRRRLPLVIVGLIVASSFLLFRLAEFQWLSPDIQREFELRGEANYGEIRRLPAQRGLIYDRDGQPLAVNALQYEIGASPNLISDPRNTAAQLAIILNQDEFALYQQLTSRSTWELIARPVSAEIGQQIADLDQFGVIINPLADRIYPQGTLAGQTIGFIIEDGDNLRGAAGVEGFYNNHLAGRTLEEEVSRIPFDLPPDELSGGRGKDVVLTIDRDLQFWVESELLLAVEESGAVGGTIIVMDPRNGDILAMASYPTLDPNTFESVADPDLLKNAAISAVYEPGSIMKVLTVAAALESRVITSDWTYNDQGELSIGGRIVRNWDRRAHGEIDTTQLLVQSLNVGAATVSLAMGPDLFYDKLRDFGIGQPTRIDLPGEEAGLMKVRGDTDWSESDLGTNSFGQGISVTSIQMITAFSAIANGGVMYQPRIVKQIIDGDRVINAQTSPLGRPISPETARIMTEMMVQVVEQGDSPAKLEGYRVAGKTGTAEIPSPIGYESGPNTTITTFIGFLPADAPQAVVLVKLDRPDGYWGSVVAAPVFKRLAERLVILLEIPTDAVRQSLAAQ